MPHAKARMAALFDVGFRAAETVNEKAAETLFSAREIPPSIHRSENIVGRDAPIKGSHQAVETVGADGRIDFVLLHDRDPSIAGYCGVLVWEGAFSEGSSETAGTSGSGAVASDGR